MTQEQVSKKELQTKLDALIQTITKRHWLYFRIRGVQNFIYHLDNIANERTRARMAQAIFAYITLLEERAHIEDDLFAAGRELTPHHWQIARVYSDELGFITEPDYFFLFLVLTIAYFILAAMFTSTAALIVVAVFAIGRIIYNYFKVQQRKFY